MEDSIIARLKSLGYNGDLVEKVTLQSTLNANDMTEPLILLVKWIVTQIRIHFPLQDSISGDKETFMIELKGILREFECPYYEVMQTNSLQSSKGKLFLLDFLISELQSCRMSSASATTSASKDSDMDTSNGVVAPLRLLLQLLQLPPVSNCQQMFQNIEKKIRDLLSKLPPNYLKEPLLQRTLDTKQWAKLSQINDGMCQEYKMRRQVLIKRVDVTIQSFSWSDKLKSKADVVSGAFQPIRTKLHADSLTSVVDILAARNDLCIIDKTSSGVAREVTKCEINKTLIGKVPDRGGRPSLVAPPPEMPKFQKRQPDTGRGGYRGGRGGGGYQGGHDNRNGSGYRGGRGGGGWRGGGGGGRDGARHGHQRDQKMYYS